MGTVTILNNTNVPINTCISAGVNYSWCNELSPKEYYVHEGGPGGVFTLNTRYWLGAETEYSHSGVEIGLFVAGIVIGVIGLIAIPVTGGASISLISASTALASGVGVGTGVAGLAIGGISIAVKDFVNSPSTFTNIQAAQNRKFIAEGKVEAKLDDKGVVVYTSLPQITLRRLEDGEFETLIRDKGFVSKGEQPISGSYSTKRELDNACVLNTQIKIRPSRGGNACWEVEDDQTKDGAPIQLWDRDTDEVSWTIESINPSEECDTFTICNKSLDRYASIEQEGPDEEITDDKRRTLTSKQRDSARLNLQSFHIIRSQDSRFQDSYSFIPVNSAGRLSAGRLVVVSEGGNTGNSTKLLLERLDRLNTNNPSWARWNLITVVHPTHRIIHQGEQLIPGSYSVFHATGATAAHPEVTLTVPPEYKIVSGGARVNWTGEGSLLTASFPKDRNTWVAKAKDHKVSSPANIDAWVIAIYDPDSKWEVDIVSQISSAANHPTISATVLSGYVLTGGGAESHWQSAGSLLTASYPDSGKAGTWTVASKDHFDSEKTTITAYAIGLRSADGSKKLSTKVVPNTSGSASHPSTKVSPETGYRLIGGGAQVNYTGDGNLLTASYPDFDGNKWIVASKDHKKPDPSTITAYAIELKTT